MVAGLVKRWMFGFLPAALALCVVAPTQARADDAAPPPEPASAVDLDVGVDQNDEDEDEDAPRFELTGRVFARAEVDQRREFSRDLSVPSARLQVKAGFGIAEAVMEADIASGSLVKDAYLRLEPIDKHLRFYAGQFKAPYLARTLESRWDLPLVSRGLVDDFLVDKQQLAGRRIGLMSEFKNKKWLGFKAELGVFQGAKDEIGQRLGEDVAGRVGFEPWEDHLEVGVGGYWADAVNGATRYAGGADAKLRFSQATLSVEGLAGRLPVGDFLAQIALLTWQQRLGDSGKWAVEPLVGVEALQLRGPVAGAARALVGGVNIHYTQRVKLMVQGERGIYAGDTALQNRFAVQLAARF